MCPCQVCQTSTVRIVPQSALDYTTTQTDCLSTFSSCTLKDVQGTDGIFLHGILPCCLSFDTLAIKLLSSETSCPLQSTIVYTSLRTRTLKIVRFLSFYKVSLKSDSLVFLSQTQSSRFAFWRNFCLGFGGIARGTEDLEWKGAGLLFKQKAALQSIHQLTAEIAENADQ